MPQLGFPAVMVTAMLAFFGLRGGSPKPPTKEETPPPAMAKVEAKDTPATTTHLTKLREFGVITDLPVGDDPRPARFDPRLTVRFLVVTVPDPIDTQLGTRFDQVIDGVMRAMADVPDGGTPAGRYTLERWWYPWTMAEGVKPAADAAPAYRTSPGVLLFRGSHREDEKYVVLLVGESPMFGVQSRAMDAALDLAAHESAACGSAAPIRVVGPCLSGTQTLMMPGLLAAQKRLSREIRLVSGSAAALGTTAEVMGRLALRDTASRHIDFSLVQAPSRLLNRAALHYLARKGEASPEDDIDPADRDVAKSPPLREVAYLVESNSGYGSMVANTVRRESRSGAGRNPSPEAEPREEDEPWLLRFPMHLSRLAGLQTQAVREREEQLGLAPPGGSQLKRLDEKRKGGDLLPSADEHRTALVNQRLLADYWETLRRERVRYVGILASDVRDTIFLIGELRREVPNAIVFVTGADMQLAHPEYLPATRGVISVTTSPPFPAAQEWSKRSRLDGKSDTRRLPFSSHNGLGTYNAVLAQAGHEVAMLNYRSPLSSPGERRIPPIWVSTIGEDGSFVPLAYFENYRSEVLFVAKDAETRESRVEARPPLTQPLRLFMLALVAGSIVGGTVILRAFRHRAGGPKARLIDRLKHQYATLVGVGLVFGTVPLAAYFGYLYFHDGLQLQRGWRVVDDLLFVATLLIAAGVGVVALWSVPCQLFGRASYGRRCIDAVVGTLRGRMRVGRGLPPNATDTVRVAETWAERVPLCLHLIGVGVAVAVAWVILSQVAGASHPGKRLLFMERAANIAGGCSPVVAGGFLALGLFLYGCLALMLLRRQSDYHVANPFPPTVVDPTPAGKPLNDVFARIDRQARHLDDLVVGFWTLLASKPAVFFGTFAAALVLIAPPLVRVHGTWEGKAWDAAFVVGVIALFVLTVAGGVRVYAVWKELERLLRLVSRVPMVSAFDRLPSAANRVFGKYLLNQRRRSEDLLIPHSILVRLDRVVEPIGRQTLEADAGLAGGKAKTAQAEANGAADSVDSAIAVEDAKDVHNRLEQAFAEMEIELEEGFAAATDRPWLPHDLGRTEAAQFSDVSRMLVSKLVEKSWSGRDVDDAYGHPSADAAGKARDDGKKPPSPPRWNDLAEQFIAIQVILFVAQYFQQLRMMFFLAALPAGALLLAVTSYPFMPERLIMYSALGLVAGVVAVIGWAMWKMNANAVVGRVSRTMPGRFGLDMRLMQNFAAVLLPLLTVVAVQVGGRWRAVVEPVLGVFQ